ncbi:Serine protease, subtilisin family [Methanophagales archaeon]|nr:Serine protease, subtilisin family [Methanophagales archaeon]
MVEGLPRSKKKVYSKPKKKRGDAERTEFGMKVLDESDKIIEKFSKWKDKYGNRIDPALIFKIEANSPINEADLDKMRLKVLGVDYKDAVVVFADDKHLNVFKKMLKEHSGEIPPSQTGARYAFIHAFEDLREITPDEKKGTRLRKEPLKEGEIAILDIELWHLGKDYREQMLSWKEGIDEILKKDGGGVTDFYPGQALFIIRAKVPSAILDDLLNFGQVARIDRPPKTVLDLAKVKRISLDEIGEIPTPEDNAPGVLIVDSGIMSGHPLLKSAIGDAQSYLNGKSPADEDGHGTAVTGIALYGDLKKCIDVKTFNPELWIFSARVCDENGDYDEEKLPETQLRDAIKYFVSNYDNVRVVNLSIGDPEEVYRVEEYQFRLAAAIDEIAFEYKDKNILFVVSAGNYGDGRTVVEYLEEKTGSRYPNYLLNDSRAKIIDPATSALALTVGSLSLGQRSAQRWFTNTLAGFEEFPSPFTRTGPGVNGMIKPDLVELGGDLSIERGSGIVTDPSIGVITTEKDFLTEGLFRVEDGTSFSAAKVSHLAAKLWKERPTATSNLIKALLTASAKIPEPEIRPPPLDKLDLKKGLAEEKTELLNIYGQGLPNLDRASFSTTNRVLLIDERKIKLNDIDIYEIPVPNEFYKGTGRRTLAVTLAFDPPTRMRRKQYLGVTMEFHLFRGVDVETIEQKYAKLEEVAVEEEIVPPSLERNKIDLVPGVNLAKKGTVQKRMWIIDRAPKDTDESLKLVVICNDKWINDDTYRQRYAVVVIVEQRENVRLYNRVREMIRLRTRIRV